MMERGTVRTIEGRIVNVSLTQGEGCASCSAQSDCHIAGQCIEAELPEGMQIEVGDEVSVEIPSSTRMEGLVWLIVLPIALLLVGHFAGLRLFPGNAENAGTIGGLGGLVLGLAIAAVATRRGASTKRPRIVEPKGQPLNPDLPDSD